MTNYQIIFFKTQGDFRKWLKKNHTKKDELWVGYNKKSSGKPSMDWSQSVDVALCFGWIDGIRKSIDEESYKIRFTPRKPASLWSSVNIKKVEELTKKGLMDPAGIEAFKKRDAKRSGVYSFERENAELNEEYVKIFKKNKKAWEFFNSLSKSVKRVTSHWVISAKQEKTRRKRLDILIKSSEAGEKIPGLRIGEKSKK
jgi:uncharacterized protein YdeI (YjbR/CyaY-like superfamily)